jgi:hypothetical protein
MPSADSTEGTGSQKFRLHRVISVRDGQNFAEVMLDTREISPMVLSKITRTHPFAMPESLSPKSPVGLKVSSLHAFSRRGKRGYALGQMVATLAAILVIGGLVGVVGFF